MTRTDRPRTLGELKSSGYRIESVKDEMRRNLIARLQDGEPLFADILGYDQTVVPQIQNAILSKHDMLLLGLRGQAKTRMLRQLVQLLDDAIPIVAGSEVHDHPFAPISKHARDLIASQGDATAIEWIGRDERYHEKLATPDVTIADLIGEVDMIKHAEGRYLSSELTMHFGLIPRTNRGIFCINELPDLAPKIQVGLFNVLEERDVQIRGYPVRLELDLCMVFSANPEDYTNRGRIVTPLKDRHGLGRPHALSAHAGNRHGDQRPECLARAGGNGAASLAVPLYIKQVVEEIARLARTSPHVNQQSGVSVRMSIANLENIVSNAERRAIVNQERWIVPRVSDLGFAAASSRGKLELTMAEDEGHEDKLIHRIIDEAVKNIFTVHLDPRELRSIVELLRFGPERRGGRRHPDQGCPGSHRQGARPAQTSGRACRVGGCRPTDREAREAAAASAAEFILEGLHVHNKINKAAKAGGTSYRR